MNKKFSTLVAVLLAAGAWTTLDAKVVEVTTPAAGSSYCIGSDTDLSDGSYDLLLGTDGKGAADQAITAESPVWTLVKSGDNYSLQQGIGEQAKAFFASTASAATLTLETIAGEHTDKAQVLFTLSDGKLVVANKADAFSSNSNINATDELKVNSAAIASLATTGNGSDFKFGVYASDNEDALSGFDLTVDDNGKVILEDGAFTASTPYAAPVYFQTEDGYLTVVSENGKLVVKALDAAPTAAQSYNASWLWKGGKLVSVAAQAAKEKATQLLVDDVPTKAKGTVTYTLAQTGSDFTVTGGVIASTDARNLASTSLYASAAVPTTNAPASTIDVTASQNIVGGSYKLATSVPSGYCVVTLGTNQYLKAGTDVSVVANISASDVDDYEDFLWSVAKTELNGKVFYSFTSLAKNKDGKPYKWALNGETSLEANEVYAGQGITLSAANTAIQVDGNTSGSEATAVIGFYEAFSLAHTKTELDKILDPGFDLTVKVTKDGKETIENIDVFQQAMYPQGVGNYVSTVELWDNEDFAAGKNAKKLVLDLDVVDGSDVSGSFKWLTPKEIAKDASRYESNFQFQYSVGNPDVISRLKVGSNRYVSVLLNNKKYYLTSSKAITNLPYIKLGSANIYAVKNLLGKLWNLSYAETKADDDDKQYKLNGILAVSYDNANVADYVASSTVAESAPEAQWMVTAANLNDNTFTLTNRENPSVKIDRVQLRKRDGKYQVYILTASSSQSASQKNIKDDIIYLTESAKKDNFQGYMQTTEYTLKSNNYHLGQYHAILGNHNAYFIENHANSHQIGAVAEKEDADKWKLHFATTKDDDDKTVVDTVYVITSYATLNAAGNGFLSANDAKTKKDTLAILPYAFQKVANREFVTFDDTPKLDFYACDETNKNDPNDATRFALKVKPNGYNFVELAYNTTDNEWELSSDKVYLANSAEGGSLKQMQTYAADQNSIMVVEAADAPEYHKIAAAWGDTIKLFRDENNSQVLYEKLDVKSVVEKDTLSFLNIDNVNQFKVNPAIFADTAYINRVDANGVKNACYQYLLAVNVDPEKSYYCPYNPTHNTDEWRDKNGGPCADAKEHKAVAGRFLINLIDTANVYGVNHIHNNPYINDVEAGEACAKLSFVEGIHTNDTLYITRKGGEAVKIAMDSPEFNVAKFAFRYVDSAEKTFKIQTQWKRYIPTEDAEAVEESKSNEGYLKWINGTVVVVNGYEKGDVFSIEENYAGNPTANDNVTVSGISVEATYGAVIVKGAQGKKVSIVNVLGQTIANTVVTSDEATIAAPAGVVVVSVEGEAAVKAIVK